MWGSFWSSYFFGVQFSPLVCVRGSIQSCVLIALKKLTAEWFDVILWQLKMTCQVGTSDYVESREQEIKGSGNWVLNEIRVGVFWTKLGFVEERNLGARK